VPRILAKDILVEHPLHWLIDCGTVQQSIDLAVKVNAVATVIAKVMMHNVYLHTVKLL
jgi:hypothetical protein